MQVFLGNGLGGFTTGPSLAAGTNTSALAIGDFDGNGAPDVAAVSEGDGGVWVFLGNGAGGLTPVAGNPVLSGLTAPRALVAADLTGDGLADLAIAESGGSAVRVLQSDGGGTLHRHRDPAGGAARRESPPRISTATESPTSWPSAAAGPSRSIRRTAARRLPPVEPYTVGASPTAVALVDLDGDPKPDIAVTSAGTTR